MIKAKITAIVSAMSAGSVGPEFKELSLSVSDSRTSYHATSAFSMHDVMSMSQAGYVDYGFLGAAQIDCYGNINTTIIGDWDKPKTRLPGSGGANDVASFSHETIIIIGGQSKRTFVDKLDFLTSPGYLTGPGAREKAGLPANGGPYRVITQLGIYDFDEKTKWMKLISVHPGVTVEEIKDNSSSDILIPESYGISPEPSDEHLRLLRTEIDPLGIAIGK